MKKALIVITIFCLALAVPVKAGILDGLEGYWPFEGDFVDASGNGHEGVPRSPGAITFEQGIQGQCILSDGSNPNGIDCGTWNPSEVTGQLGLSIWAIWNGPTGGWQGLFSKRNGWGKDDYWTIEADGNTSILSFFCDGSTNVPHGGTVLETGVWNHVAVSFDGTEAIYYINGQEIGRGDFSFGANPDAVVNIGSSDNWNGWNGAIDEAVIWNRAITPKEVARLYNGGNGMDLFGNPWRAEIISPVDGVSGVPSTGTTLQWSPPTEEQPPSPIKNYNVYFGTDEASIGDIGDPNAEPVTTVLASELLEYGTGALEMNTVYFWRVDALVDDVNLAYGNVWSFDTTESAPVIISNPVTVLGEEGSTVSLTFGVSSYSEVTYSWFKEGLAESIGLDAALVLEDVSLSDEGFYYCQASNAGGMTESARAGFERLKLLAHYKFDDIVNVSDANTLIADSGQFEHDGIEIGEVQSFTGIIDGALLFGGAGDYVDCGTWNPNAISEELTISIWAKWDGLNGQWQGMIGKRDDWGNGGANMMWQIEANADTGVLSFARDGSDIPNMGYVLPDGEWTHVAVTFDGTTAIMYIDGNELSRGPFSFGSKTDSALQIGAINLGGTNPFNGELDDVRIYNYVLEPISIIELYTIGSGDKVCFGGNPVYDFNGDCTVDFSDIAMFAAEWLDCNMYPQSSCP